MRVIWPARPFTFQVESVRERGGNGSTDAYYDTALNITWLADAEAFQGNGDDSKAWADNLVVGAYSGWRLPTMVDVGNNGCTTFSLAGGVDTDCGYNVDIGLSDMAHMYYVTLGNKGYFAPGTLAGNQPGWGLSNTGPFSNVQSDGYWSGVEYAPDTGNVWYFHNGDVAAVPEPEIWSLALAGLGIAGLAVRRMS